MLEANDPRSWDSPGMRKALREPRNKCPLRETDHTGVLFEVDEMEFVDRPQAAALRQLEASALTTSELTPPVDCGMIDGSRVLEEDQ